MATVYDKPAMQKWAAYVAGNVWGQAFLLYGARIGSLPEIRMNSRLTATGGRAMMRTARNVRIKPNLIEWIDFSCYLMNKDYAEYKAEIIPHELAHFIAFRVYGEENHGPMFKKVMQDLGCNGCRCHTIETKSQAERKNAK